MRILSHTLLVFSLATVLNTSTALAESEPQPNETERWIGELSQKLLEKGAVSGTYLNNYLQCLQDEKNLREEPDSDLEKLLQQLLGASHNCAPIIEEMVEALKKDDAEADALRQQLQDLERSL
ncbi:hypothetical protein QKW35_00270 [Pontibacterium granulatum]|uniref:hypothetical protein n=1 Tax=Pontibacterium granulatum TaxID=2036029 RepID=UPI00249ADD26|nr:hypothetical protein [Pontibacterium granulatum]MDI3322798.1 hypothetical protein [Pontibacterium granulatum]